MKPDEQLRSLAEAVSDGAQVDWERAEAGVEGELREAVGRLRRFAELADAYAQDEHSPAGPEQDAGGTAAVPVRAVTDAPVEWAHLRLKERLGGGTFGVVYRAVDPRLERDVALKLLYAESHEREMHSSSVIREARLLAKLRHPNIVTVHGAERAAGRVGLWMEYVRGRTLRDLVDEQGALGPAEAALIGVDLCRALGALHQVSLVHRDLKAQNVMREEGGRIVLMDLGAGVDRSDPEDAGAVPLSGTPLYMPPEVLAGAEPDATSDLYSLGVLLFYLVTGSYPVQAASVELLQGAHARGELRLVRDVRPDLPESFARIVDQALATPGQRFASAGAMQAALASFLGAPSPARQRFWEHRPMRAALLAGALVLAMAVALWRIPSWLRNAPQRAGETPARARSDVNLADASALEHASLLRLALGSYAEARALQQQALALRERRYGSDSAPVAEALSALAWIRWTEGADDEARALGQRALMILTQRLEAQDPRLTRARLDLRQLEGGAFEATGSVHTAVPAAEARLGALSTGNLLDSPPYELESSLYRYDADGQRRRLEDGARVVPGDRLGLELRASAALYLYVLSEDARGECYLLFPLPGYEPGNPLSAGPHRLPGQRNGADVFWVVTSRGGREQVLVLASPSRLAELEHEIQAIPRASEQRAVALSSRTAQQLRGIGGLGTSGGAEPATTPNTSRLFALARKLSAGPERARGVSIRRVVLDNPPS